MAQFFAEEFWHDLEEHPTHHNRLERREEQAVEDRASLHEEDGLVPSQFLQPLADNAIWPGPAPKGGGHVAVEISQHEGNLQCVLRDDGVGRQSTAVPADGKPRHASVGMRLIAERLHAFAALEGQSAAFVLHDLKDEAGRPLGTEVVIRLPLVVAV